MDERGFLRHNLTGSHPFSLVPPIKDTPNLVASLVSQGKTADPTGKVKLVNGNVECTSCHDPHVQAIDKVAQQFLVRDSSRAQMCLACHDPNRVVQGQINPLAGFTNSIHQTATNQISPDAHVGPYTTVGQNSCSSCHMSHDSIAPARLLRPATPAATSYDPATQSCMTCHAGGTYLSPATVPNIMAEVGKISHPLPAGKQLPRCGRSSTAAAQPACGLRGLPFRAQRKSGDGVLGASGDSAAAARRDGHQRGGWHHGTNALSQSV